MNINALVPGGILPTDFLHRSTHDGTCSRCRKMIPDDDVPIMAWCNEGNDLWAYCERCCEVPALDRAARRWQP